MGTKIYMARVGQLGRNREDEMMLCLLNIVELGKDKTVTIFRDHAWIFASEMPLTLNECDTVLFEASYDCYETRKRTQGTLTHIKFIRSAPGFNGLHPKGQPITVVLPPNRNVDHAQLLTHNTRQSLDGIRRDIFGYAKENGWIYNFLVLDNMYYPKDEVSVYTDYGLRVESVPYHSITLGCDPLADGFKLSPIKEGIMV